MSCVQISSFFCVCVQSTQPALRVGVVYNPVEVLSHVILSRAVWAAIHSQHPQKVAALIEALLRVQPVDSIEGVVRIAQELEVSRVYVWVYVWVYMYGCVCGCM